MSDNKIKIVIEVDSGDLKQAESIAKNLNRSLNEASGKRKIGGSAAAGAAMDTSMSDYRKTRGITGQTGAGGRDFAKQAQGLGGLVHLYATFAANIFAVTTAYQGLESAFQSKRMEESAKLISSRIGVNVLGLAKDLQKATDNAISFKDALEFTNTATGAGLSGKQIKSLTVIAKGAASALNRDTTDSVQRIIRGTAKQEQEILDELGIFVKAKQAYKDYAAARGIADENTLTATQRVQAYADAVEKAGEKWKEFAQVEDPFGRFSASITETATKIANFANSAIAPVLSTLADYPTIITGIMLASITKLAKMALPQAAKVMSSLFKVDPAAIEKEIKYATESATKALAANIESKKSQLNGDLKSNLVKDLAKSEFSKFNAENYLASGLQRGSKDTLGSELAGEKLMQSALSQRLASIKRIKDETQRNVELTKLQTSDLVIIDGLSQKIVLSEKGKALANKEIKAIITEQNAELTRQKALKGEIAALEKQSLATNIAALAAQQKNAQKIKNSQSLNTALEGISNAATLGGSSGLGKFRDIMKATSSGIKEVWANTKGLGGLIATANVAKVAISGLAQSFNLLLGPIGWIITAMSLWDIAFKPLITSLGGFHKDTGAADDAITSFSETIDNSRVTLLKNSEVLKYVGTDLDTLGNKHMILANLATESVDKMKEAYDSLKLSLTNMGWLDKILGTDSSQIKDFAKNLRLQIDQELAKPSTENKTLLMSFREQLDGAIRTGNLATIEKIYPGLQRIISASGEAERALSTVVETGKSRAKDMGDSWTNLIEKFENNKDTFTKAFKSEEVKTMYTKMKLSIADAASGGVEQFSGLKNVIDAIPESVAKNIVAFAKMRLLIDDINKIPDEKARNAALQKNIPIFEKLSKEGFQQADSTLSTNKGGGRYQDPEARLYAQRMQLLEAERALQNANIADAEFRLSQEKKFAGVASENLISEISGKRKSLILLEKEKSLEEAKEKLRLSLRNKDVNNDTAKSVYAQTVQAINKDADTKLATEAAKAAQEVLESNNILLVNKIKLQQQDLSLQSQSLDASKELGEISSSQYITDKLSLDLLNISLKAKEDLVNKTGEAAQASARAAEAEGAQAIASAKLAQLVNERRLALIAYNNQLTKSDILIQRNLKFGKPTLDLEENRFAIFKAQKEAEINRTKDLVEQEELRLQIVKEQIEFMDRRHEAAKREFFTNKNVDRTQVIFEEADRREGEFKASMRSTVDGVFDSIYGGMDAAIDELTTKWMNSEKFSFKELVQTFRNYAAEEFRKMAADQAKLAIRFIGKQILGSIFKINMPGTPEEKIASFTERTAIATEAIAMGAGGTSPTAAIMDQTESTFNSIQDKIKDAMGSFGEYIVNLSSSLGQFFSSIGSALSGSGGGGLGGITSSFGGLINSLTGGLTDGMGAKIGSWIGENMGMEGIWGKISGLFFANGGIMSDYGPLKLNKYENGGIATSPQLAVFGEGRKNEAYVPLPDGRSIPVTMSSPTEAVSGGNNISINIVVNNNGTSETTANGNSSGVDAKALAKAVKTAVREEILNQQRSGNTLSSTR